jgi:hypothetical protein
LSLNNGQNRSDLGKKYAGQVEESSFLKDSLATIRKLPNGS